MLVYFTNNAKNRPCVYFTKQQSRHIYTTSVAHSTSKWTVSLKLFKCCPRFPLRRQNKEATRSTPRTVHNNNTGLFSTQELAGQTFRRKLVFLIPDIFARVKFYLLFHNICRVNGPDCWAMAAAVVGASGSDCYIHPRVGDSAVNKCHNPPKPVVTVEAKYNAVVPRYLS